MKLFAIIYLLSLSLFFGCQKETATKDSSSNLKTTLNSFETSSETRQSSKNLNVDWSQYLFAISGHCEDLGKLEFKSLETKKPIELYGNPEGLQIRAKILIYLIENGEFSLTYKEFKYSSGQEVQDFEKIIQGQWTVESDTITLGSLATAVERLNEKGEKSLSIKFLKNISDPRLIEISDIEFIYKNVGEDPFGQSEKDYCLGLN